LDNLKLIDKYNWLWLTRLKRNRQVNPDVQGNRPIHEVELNEAGTVVHLKGYGFIRVFKIVAPDGDIDYGANNYLNMSVLQGLYWSEWKWLIEEYHRGLKQCCEVEKTPICLSRSQRNHIGLAICAFLYLEMYWFNTGMGWDESNLKVIRSAVHS
jgi:hypothetical protein